MAYYPLYNGMKETGNLATVTNVADDTYYYYVDMSYYEGCSFQGSMSCGAGTVTLTIEGTLQDDGTAQASCTYADITNAVFGVAGVVATAGAATVSLFDLAQYLGAFKYVRVKIISATTGAGAQLGDWTINYIRRRGL